MSSNESPFDPALADDKTIVTAPRGTRPLADPNRTQIGVTQTCPVCRAVTPSPEIYCGDCGFLLSTQPGGTIETPSEETPPAELVDEATGRHYRLHSGVNTIGRQGADILGLEPTVSRLHARVVVTESSITVEDLGSSNGTKVGTQRLSPNQPARATHGMPISFGNWRLTLHVAAWEDLTPLDEPTLMIPGEGKPHAPTTRAIPSTAVALLKKVEGALDDIPLYHGSITIGRRTSNIVPIPHDAYVSGRHAEIIADDAGVFLVDLGSTNGTLLNDQKLVPNLRNPLHEGDDIRIGQNRFQFQSLRATANAEPPASTPVAEEAPAPQPEAAPADETALPPDAALAPESYVESAPDPSKTE